MDAVIEFTVTLVQSTFLLIVECIKAILPIGFLRRKNVEGSVVLITGSGSGLGRMMAVEFAKLGCRLVLWDVNTKGNEETKTMLEKLGTPAYAYTVNLAKKEEINAVAAKVKEEVGNVDILINNAGIVTGKKLFDAPDELMELTMAVNTNALFFTAKNFIPSMLENNHGHIVTIASMAGKTGAAGLVDYCASKHGAVGFHESLTAEISSQGKTGVKTTCVCPYYIDTGMFDGVQTKFPTLLPIMKPEFVIENIMEAILTDKVFIALPKFCYVVLAVGGFLPSSVSLMLSNYFGINETMDHFTGRKKAN